MIAFPAGAKVWLAGGATDMRFGMNSLALKVPEGLGRDPHGGEIFVRHGTRTSGVLVPHSGAAGAIWSSSSGTMGSVCRFM